MSSYTTSVRKGYLGLLASFTLVISTISLLYVGADIQSTYAQQAVKTLKIKVTLDKNVITRGNTQTIRYKVVDATTGQPVSGAIARATVDYADGVTVRQFTTTTDASGQATISWRIESNATPGTFSATFGVSATSYVGESFDLNFLVVSRSINDGNHHHHHH
jgi:hypothetical protein